MTLNNLHFCSRDVKTVAFEMLAIAFNIGLQTKMGL